MQDRDIHTLPETTLSEAGYIVRYSGITALDRYYRRAAGSVIDIETDADLIALSTLFDDIEFPGEERIDALLEFGDECQYAIRIIDSEDDHASPLPPFRFYYYPARRIFLDSDDSYRMIRNRESLESSQVRQIFAGSSSWHTIGDIAEAAARYDWAMIPSGHRDGSKTLLGSREQRKILQRLLESPFPGRGLAILMDTGFVHAHWPLLAAMQGIAQDKDFHPEGDVWNHTLEMYRYLKVPDREIAMGILLHDCGKAFSQKQNNNEFDRHSQIGADRGIRFLQGLGFPEEYVSHVRYLVTNHMLPAHIAEIPHRSIETVLSDPLFPKLLELYRCDISSSFRDPEGYYRACESYRRFKKLRRNPYRIKPV